MCVKKKIVCYTVFFYAIYKLTFYKLFKSFSLLTFYKQCFIKYIYSIINNTVKIQKGGSMNGMLFVKKGGNLKYGKQGHGK